MEHVRKMQSRLSHAVNLAAANKLHESIMGDGPSDPSKNAKLRAFSASRGVLANRFVNRLHKSSHNRYLTNPQLRLVVWEALGVELYTEVNFNCRHCGKTATTYTEHSEACQSSRRKIRNNVGENNIINTQRAAQLHYEGKLLLRDCLRQADGTTVGDHEPYCHSYFPLKAQRFQELDNWNHRIGRWNEAGDRGREDCNNTNGADLTSERRAGIRADLLVHAPIGLRNQTYLVDFTVSGIHFESNHKHAYKKLNNRLNAEGAQQTIYAKHDYNQGGVADAAESAKNDLYSKFDHIEVDAAEENEEKGTKHIIPFALDSRGGMGMDALNFVRGVYGRTETDGPVRSWPSDSMRTSLRNQFLDKLSCLLARHRAFDYIFMGIPDAKRDDGFQPSPYLNIMQTKRKGNINRANSKNSKDKNIPHVNSFNNTVRVN